MIVRILGDRLYDVPDDKLTAIDTCDAALQKALEEGDEAAFDAALTELLLQVRRDGTALDDDDARASDLVLPHEGSTLQDVRDIFDAETEA